MARMLRRDALTRCCPYTGALHVEQNPKENTSAAAFRTTWKLAYSVGALVDQNLPSYCRWGLPCAEERTPGRCSAAVNQHSAPQFSDGYTPAEALAFIHWGTTVTFIRKCCCNL
ncbi:hypothetical protein KIL84_022344 [Mauremys mutica]|uniref:Uncharacterized protein n=1 Tax=Mauremys mutica TaxID=74926 RepID=A0A9D3X8I1_9SAUR|nr:hypothetical protein KIL84_022344 [Mauremys mutica]